MNQNAIAALVNTNVMLPVGKTGKVSKSVDKVGHVLRDASALATISAAIYGKGTAKKVAVLQLRGLHTVEFFTDRESIDGGEWSDFLMALVARHGEKTFNPQTMRGKAGVVAYLRNTLQDHEVKGASDGWTESRAKKVAQVEQDLANAERLMAVAIEAAKAAEEVAAE